MMRHPVKAAIFASIIMILSLMLLSGCSLHASRLPDKPVGAPGSFIEAVGGEGTEPLPFEAVRWWERFGDGRLNALMDEAFAENLDLAQGYERLAQAEATAGVAVAARWPSLNAAASGGKVRSRGFTGVQGFSGFAASESYTLSASASYEIDLWRKLSSRTRAARLDALAARGDLESIYITLSAELADLYYLAVEQRAQLELTDSTIDVFRDTLERVERRYRAGLVPALDVYQSRENLASARARRPEFASSLERTGHAISVLLGRAPERGIGGVEASLPDPPKFSAGLPSDLLTRRPDIRAALNRLEASDKRVAAAVADRFPSFNLIGDYGGASADIGSILDSPNIFWNILVQAAAPLIDGGRRRAEVRRTEAALRESLVAYKKTVLTSFKEVEDALSAGRASSERIRMLEERVAASDAALKLSLDQYMQGLSDYLPVLTEQQGLFEAESELLNAKRRLISERIGLARALGGGWPEAVVNGRLADNSGKDQMQ